MKTRKKATQVRDKKKVGKSQTSRVKKSKVVSMCKVPWKDFPPTDQIESYRYNRRDELLGIAMTIYFNARFGGLVSQESNAQTALDSVNEARTLVEFVDREIPRCGGKQCPR